MAIKYYNITDTSDNQLETIKGVLESVASNYFTSFVLSEDKFTLSCYDGENPILVFNMVTGCKQFNITINGASGVSYTSTSSSTTAVYCQRITTTACGIALKYKFGTAGNKNYGIFITKTKNGKTAVFMQLEGVISSSNATCYCITSESSNVGVISKISSSSKPDYTDMTQKAYILVSGTTDYCPDLYNMVNSQYYGNEGIIDIDGVKYLSNGYHILKDE